MLQRVVLLCAIILLASSLTGCLLRGYRYEVQQGNILTLAEVQSIRIGMTEEQVIDILGSPILYKLYQDNQLAYAYTMKPGRGPLIVRYLIIYFNNNNQVSAIRTNVEHPEAPPLPAPPPPV